MATNKTSQTDESVLAFIDRIEDETKRTDALSIVKLFEKQTHLKPKMWGPSIIGFGGYAYKYDSGHEGTAPLLGFSARKTSHVFYLSGNFDGREEMLKKLGKHKTGKGCVYVNKLADINVDVLKEMIDASLVHSHEQVKKNNWKLI
jgi:hypothetical protein